MFRLTVEIDTKGEVFQDPVQAAEEIRKILESITQRFQPDLIWGGEGKCIDSNGNVVGRWHQED